MVRTNLFIHSRFWSTYTKFDNCCLRYIGTCGKDFYIGPKCSVHIYILGPVSYCCGIFFKSLSYLYEVVRTNFSADFWTSCNL